MYLARLLPAMPAPTTATLLLLPPLPAIMPASSSLQVAESLAEDDMDKTPAPPGRRTRNDWHAMGAKAVRMNLDTSPPLPRMTREIGRIGLIALQVESLHI